MVFLGSIIGVISIVFSASIFIFKEVNYWYLSIRERDIINIKSFMEYDDLVIHNGGFRSITLLEIEVSSDELNRSSIYEVNETIAVNGVLSPRVGRFRKVQMATIDRDLVSIAARDSNIDEVLPVAASPKDRDFVRWSERSTGDPILFPCKGTLHFIPEGETDVRSKDFECVYFAAFTPNIEKWSKIRQTYKEHLEEKQ